MTKKDSIYCLDCISLEQSHDIMGQRNYCRLYEQEIRLESTSECKGGASPVKCLDCLLGLSGNYAK